MIFTLKLLSVYLVPVPYPLFYAHKKRKIQKNPLYFLHGSVFRSHGGYTPLHIAAQHGHQQVFDLLVQAYKADANLR
jgi:hypothetical protein